LRCCASKASAVAVTAVLRAAGPGGGGLGAHLGRLCWTAPRRRRAGAAQRLAGRGDDLAPALTSAWPVVLGSGLLFGAVFLSVVASTTAFVRHNLPQAQWAAGISAFTVVFALGQIVGPTVVGWVADGPGGLTRGLVYSAAALWLGAALAAWQRPLPGSAATR
jgi:hypothetical protein